MRTELQPSFPAFFRAPIRRVGAKVLPAVELTMPDLKTEAASIPNFALLSRSSKAARGSLQTIYERLGGLGEKLLNNDSLFNYVRLFITNPNNLNQFQALVNFALNDALARGEHKPGAFKRANIQNDGMPLNEISFGEQTFEMKLDDFDIIFLQSNTANKYPCMLVPVYIITEKGLGDKKYIKVSFDITSDSEALFVESIEIGEERFGIGVAFIGTEDSDMKRAKPVWLKHKEFIESN